MCQLLSPLYPTRVKEVWAIFNLMGWTGHGETCPLGARIHLSLYYGSTTPLCLASSWIHYEIYLLVLSSQTFTHPAPRSFCWDCGRGFGGPPHHLGTLMLLPSVPPLFILGLTFNPFKERSTDECYVFVNSIVWNLSPWFGHIAVPRRWEWSKLQRA